MKVFLSLFLMLGVFSSTLAQDKFAFYIRIPDKINVPVAERVSEEIMKLRFDDSNLNKLFEAYEIYHFEQAVPISRNPQLLNVYLLQCNDPKLVDILLKDYSRQFTFAEQIENEDEVILDLYPDDYGTTSPLPSSNPFAMKGHDLIGMPAAWDLTLGGSQNVTIGISDGKIDSTSYDVQGRVSNYLDYFDASFCPSGSTNLNCTHGTSVFGVAAAKADNGYGLPGICYNCDVIATKYALPGVGVSYPNLLELSYAGAKIINTSWSISSYSVIAELIIDEIHENGTVLVASTGNESSGNPESPRYPASYDHVISVTVLYAQDSAPYNVWTSCPYSTDESTGCVFTIEDGFTYGYTYPDFVPLTSEYFTSIPGYELDRLMYHNPQVDIAAPARDVYLLGSSEATGIPSFGGATSTAAPMVSGVLGLLYSVNYCLAPEEAESILKLTSKDIEQHAWNSDFVGKLGAGRLNAYPAVKMAKAMHDATGVVEVKDRDFYRFDFDLHTAPYKIEMSNQTFRADATVDFKARNSIEILASANQPVVFAPNENGFVKLSIDPDLPLSACGNPNLNLERKTNPSQQAELKTENPLAVFPNPTSDKITIDRSTSYGLKAFGAPQRIEIYTLEGKLLRSIELRDIHFPFTINFERESSGTYLLKVVTSKDTYLRKVIKH